MRPVTRGTSPQLGDFSDCEEAKPFLLSRLGPFCSYCERRIATQLAVEHIQPKGLPQYQALAGRWDNFLLACVNCNSTKKNKDVLLDRHYLPDRDNTFAAFDYLPDGTTRPRQAGDQIASDTLALTGLHKPILEIFDENGKLVAMDRVGDRMTVWGIALDSKADLNAFPTDGMRRRVLAAAAGHGFFSVWMTVFAHDAPMRRLLIEGFTTARGEFCGFPGTARECFDAATQPVSPRPATGLAHGSKI